MKRIFFNFHENLLQKQKNNKIALFEKQERALEICFTWCQLYNGDSCKGKFVIALFTISYRVPIQSVCELFPTDSTLLNSAIVNHLAGQLSGWPSGLTRLLFTFPSHNGGGRSGLRMEAWVRIPLLTRSLFMATFFVCI